MIGRRGFIGLVTGAVAGVLAAARGAFGAAREVERDLAAFPDTWPQLGEVAIIRQWCAPRTAWMTAAGIELDRPYREIRLTVTGLTWQASNEANQPADFTMLLAGYQDVDADPKRHPWMALGPKERATFNLSLRMDQATLRRVQPGGQLRIDWAPWGRP